MNKITFVHTADLHLSSAYSNCPKEVGFSFRTKDAFANFSKVIDYTIKKDPTFLFIAGDIFNSANVKKEIVSWFVTQLGRLLANTKKVKVFIITGQHDLASDGTTAVTLLRSTCENLVSNSRIMIYDETGHKFLDKENECWVYSVPFSNDIVNELKIANRDVKRWTDNFCKILVTHLPFSGSVVGDYTLENENKASLVDGFDYVAAGDIHKSQKLFGNVYYPGSLIKLNFGERNDQKGFFVGQIRGPSVQVKFVPVEDRELLVLSIKSREDFNKIIEADLREKVKGNIVKIKFWLGGELTLEDNFALEQKMTSQDKAVNIVSEIKYFGKNDGVVGNEKIGFGLSFDEALEKIIKEIDLPKGITGEKIRDFVKGIRK